jgi:hypothetical protein
VSGEDDVKYNINEKRNKEPNKSYKESTPTKKVTIVEPKDQNKSIDYEDIFESLDNLKNANNQTNNSRKIHELYEGGSNYNSKQSLINP